VPSFVAASAVVGNGSTNQLVVPVPAGTSDGDLQIAVIGIGTSSESITGVPPGWTLAASASGTGSDSFRTVVYTSTTDTADATWTKSGTREAGGVRVTYSSHNGVSGTVAIAFNSASSTSQATPSVTQVTGGLVVGGVHVDLGAGPPTFTPPAGWTERVDGSGGTTPPQGLTVADVAAAPGSVSGTFTLSAADDAIAWAMVIAPPAGGGGSTNHTRAVTDLAGLTDSSTVTETEPPPPPSSTGAVATVTYRGDVAVT
jgi:hypothetical protein